MVETPRDRADEGARVRDEAVTRGDDAVERPARASGSPAASQATGMALVREELRALGLPATGILCGHVWIWEVAHRAGEALPGFAASVPLYLSLTAFMLLMTIVTALARPRPRPLALLDWPLAAVMAVGTVLLCLPASLPLPASPREVAVAGAVLGGVGIGWSYLQWGCYYASLDVRGIIAAIFGAMALGSVVKLPLDVLPPVACCVACVALCLLGPALVRLAWRRLAAGGRGVPKLGYADAPRPRLRDAVEGIRPFVKVFVGVIAYGLVIGISQGIVVPADPMPKWVLSGVHHALEVVAALAMLWYVLGGKSRGLRFSSVWVVVLISTGAGVMLLPLVGPAFTGWALIAVAVAQTLVVMLLWAMLADVARAQRDRVCPVAVFGLGWTVYSLPFPIGHQIGATLGDTGAGAAWIGLIIYVLAVATALFLNDRDFSQNRIFAGLEPRALPVTMGDAVARACRAIGAEAGLTDRETDVLRLLSLGHSKGYVAENLCISENTVRSHARHLYAKLGVHSKQELLDLVMAAMDAGGSGARRDR